MAVAAKFRKYNGTSWEEITFPPSDHTHEEYANKTDIQTLTSGEGVAIGEDGAINLSGEYNGDFEIKELKINGASGGMINDISGATIGFNDEGMPTIVNKEGRYIAIATDELDGNYKYYDFPDFDGTVVLADPETGYINVGSGIVLNPVDNYIYSDEIYVGEGDEVYISSDGISTYGDIYCQDLHVNGTIYGGVPTYYMHHIYIDGLSSGTCSVSLMLISKQSEPFTVATLYSTYGNEALTASGYYGTNIVTKLAFTSPTQARFVYGSTPSTGVVTITGLTDNVIPV